MQSTDRTPIYQRHANEEDRENEKLRLAKVDLSLVSDWCKNSTITPTGQNILLGLLLSWVISVDPIVAKVKSQDRGYHKTPCLSGNNSGQ